MFKIPYTRVIFKFMIHLQYFDFPQKLASNQYIYGRSYNISSLRYISPPLPFLKILRTNAKVELINFQDIINKSNFIAYYERTVFDLPERLVATNIWMFLEQFLLRYQLQLFLKNVSKNAYVQLINFTDPVHKSDFNIYHPVTVFHFPVKLAENQYIHARSQNISCISDISSPLPFLKKQRNSS